ncbi:MAG: hypothetical protein RSB08_01220 [Clostridia bacterium]
MLEILLKKQFIEKFSNFKRHKNKIDVLGALLSLFLAVMIIGLVIVVFSKFLKVYCNIRIDGVYDVLRRQAELLTIIYFIIFIVGIFSGAKAINYAIFEADDLKILMVLPIKSTTLFVSKMLYIYFKQIAVSIFTIVPINVAFAIVVPQGGQFITMTAIMCLIFPLLTLIVSSVICLPMFYVKRFVQNKYLMSLLIVTTLLGIAFWGYSEILQFIKQIMISGDIAFFFNEKIMTDIINITKYLFPSNIIANVLLGINLGKNLAIILCFALVGTVLGGLVVNALFSSAIKMRAKSSFRPIFNVSKLKHKQHSLIGALFNKEFNQIYRTPDYAFSYFSTAIIMPLMVYFCMSIGKDLLQSLIFIESNLELAILVVLMFSVLTNTFCATNISREGKAFYAMKTMPISQQSIVFSKILFCSIISIVTVGISCLIVGIAGYTSALETVFLLFIAILISEAQICFATRNDFNHPRFLYEDDAEVKESNSTISTVIVLGLFIAAVLGGMNLYISVFYGARGGAEKAQLISMLVLSLLSLIVFFASIAYLLIGLDKTYAKLGEGEDI